MDGEYLITHLAGTQETASVPDRTIIYFCIFIKSTQLACLVQQERTQMEGGPESPRSAITDVHPAVSKKDDLLLRPNLHSRYTWMDRGPPSGLVHKGSIQESARESPTQQSCLSTD